MVGVVAALRAEARTLHPSVARGDGLQSLEGGALLAVSGMGAPAAASAARRLLDAGAGALLSFGLAGGLDPALGPGTIVLADEVIRGDGASYPTDEAWRGRMSAALEAHPVVRGRILSSVAPLASPAAKAAAFRERRTLAVDMESFAVAEVAAAGGLPFAALRVIVDTALDSLPRSVLYAARADGPDLGRLLRGLLAAPADVVGLMRLARRYRPALKALERAGRIGVRCA